MRRVPSIHEIALIGFLAAVSLAPRAVAQSPPKQRSTALPPAKLGRTALAAPVFIENTGQFDPNVRFQLKIGSRTAWFTSTGVVFDVQRRVANPNFDADSLSSIGHELQPTAGQRGGGESAPQNHSFERLVFSEDFANGSASKIEPSRAQPGIYNYFIGKDPKNWRTRAVGYSQLLYEDVWPGIDVRFVAKGADIEQEFLVHPGADPSLIRVAYRGAEGLRVEKGGSLIVQTLFGPLREGAPRIYQEIGGRQTSVRGSYAITGEFEYTFNLGSYRGEHSLVIDPTLLYSTYIGSSGSDSGGGIAVDSAGNAYMGGTTQGGAYPTTPGVFQVNCPSAPNCQAAVVTKFDALGRLSYSTFLGSLQGASVGGDTGRGIAVNSAGEAYVTGLVNGGFPTTANAFQSGCSGSSFLAKLNSTGTALLYSTCLGYEGYQAAYGAGAYAIALDAAGRAYVTGMTAHAGSPFPTTSNAYQPAIAGNANAFMAVIDPSLSGASSLVYSTYLGGEFDDYGRAIAVDAYGNAYITGNTISSHFPVTAHAFQQMNKQTLCSPTGQCNTAFVAKLNPSIAGTGGLIYSSYLGGNIGNTGGSGTVGDYGSAIAVDSSGNAYVAGSTNSLNFPTTSGAFESSTTCSADGFVTKVNAGGSALVYSTFLTSSQGCGGATAVSGIALDLAGNAYVVGGSTNSTFPVTPDAFQSTKHAGGNYGYDAILTELNASGSALIYSTFLGGNGDDGASGVAVDATGDVYITGATYSTTFPITPFAFQPVSGGGADAFVTKFPFGSTLRLLRILPNSGGNVGTITASIDGSGFHSGAAVALVSGSHTVSGASPIVVSRGQTIDATFDLSSTPPGIYSVVVKNPDGSTLTLSNGFTVEQGGGPQLSVTIVGPKSIGTGHGPVGFSVYVQNAGNTDAVGVMLSLYGIPSEAILKPLFVISPPPAELGGTTYDFTQIPFAPVVGQEQIPNLLLPNVPAGGRISLSFTLALNSLPAVGPLQPQPPPLHGASTLALPGSTSSGAAVNITAGITMFNTFCTSTGMSCLQNAMLTRIDLLEIIPGFGNLISFYNCVQDFACAKAVLILAKTQYAGSIFDVTALMGKTMLDCCGTVPVYGNVIKATEAAASVIVSYLDCVGWLNGVGGTITIAAAVDPNDKEGAPGAAASRWVAGTNALPYGIYFLNEATATAAAQGVSVTDTLDSSLDLSTLALNGVVIGGNSIPLPPTFTPALGQNQASTVVDFRPAQSLLVNVNVSLDPPSRTLSWQFTSVDPITGLSPSNLNVGVLPPGVGGSVSYSAKPMQTVTTGTNVSNQATIVFDTSAAMNTPTWANTIDNTPPVSHVSALAATSTCPNFKVSWSGSDVGSGLQGFNIYVSDTGAPYTAWLSNTTAASAPYLGAVGHSYSFYSIAADLTGNIEGAKPSPEASTSVNASGPCGPPSLGGQLSNVVHSGTTVTATLTLTNMGFTTAQAVNINQITFRTLSGSGAVSLASPVLPASEGPLAIGASITIPLTLNVPTTVTRISITESGNLQDGSGNNYNYSVAQTVIP